MTYTTVCNKNNMDSIDVLKYTIFFVYICFLNKETLKLFLKAIYLIYVLLRHPNFRNELMLYSDTVGYSTRSYDEMYNDLRQICTPYILMYMT